MELEVQNDALNIKFSVQYEDNMSLMFRRIDDVLNTMKVDESKRFSASSFKKVMRDETESVKGWRFTIANQVQSRVNETDRKVAKRDEERAARKAHKKAEKMAKKNVQNGNRKRLGAQERYVQKHKRPQLNPILSAMINR